MTTFALDLFATELTPDAVLATLGAQCVGEAHGVTVRELHRAVTGLHGTPACERKLRHIVEALRRAGHPICATPTHGYYIAADAAELDRACEFLYGRAMTSLRQVSALRRVALPDLLGQLRLHADDSDAVQPATTPTTRSTS